MPPAVDAAAASPPLVTKRAAHILGPKNQTTRLYVSHDNGKGAHQKLNLNPEVNRGVVLPLGKKKVADPVWAAYAQARQTQKTSSALGLARIIRSFYALVPRKGVAQIDGGAFARILVDDPALQRIYRDGFESGQVNANGNFTIRFKGVIAVELERQLLFGPTLSGTVDPHALHITKGLRVKVAFLKLSLQLLQAKIDTNDGAGVRVETSFGGVFLPFVPKTDDGSDDEE